MYNLASNVLTQTYPSNRTATYGYNAAAQLTSFTGTLGDGVSRTYANTISYTPAGLMTKERFGTTTPLYHNVHYNSRLQMVDIRLGTSSTDEWTWNRGALITYFSNQARNAGNAFLNAADNNGNVTMAEHYVPTDDAISSYSEPLRDTYEYDALNRLTQTNGLQRNTAGSWTADYVQWYSYDRYGNRTINNGSTWGTGINNLAYSISPTNNRINGVTYDAAGNVTSDPNGVTTATYDAENRMRSALKGGVQSYYVYDADGKRVRRITSGVETWQIYGIEGELVAEYPANGAATTPQKEYGYRGGQMLIVGGCDVVRWIVADHLGTPRMEVDPSGSLATMRRHDYLPFGEELTVGMGNGSIRTAGMGYTSDCVRQRFTDKERDTETGLDYFEARYFASVQGRFISVDPYSVVLDVQYEANTERSGSKFLGYLAMPQKWNRYAYALNNPGLYIDPDGKDVTIYYRPMKEGDWQYPDAGHVLIYVKNDVTGEGRYFDYYGGADGNGEYTVLNGVDQSRLDAHARLTIETTADQEQSMLNAIAEFAKAPTDFDASKTSLLLGKESDCVVQCSNILGKGGLNIGARTPKGLWQNAYERYGADKNQIRYEDVVDARGDFQYTRLQSAPKGYYLPELKKEYGRDTNNQGVRVDPKATDNRYGEYKGGRRQP